MKKISIILTTLLLAVAGCSKEEIAAPQAEGGKTILTAGFADTKTVLGEDGKKVYWTTGDKIAVNGVLSDAMVLDEPASQVDFKMNGLLDHPYKAVFPASVYVDENTVSLPSLQAACENSFAPDASVMAAYAEGGNTLTFSHLCSVLKLTVMTKAVTGEEVADTDVIRYVEFKGKKGEQVCGKFTIDYKNKTLAPAGGTNVADQAVRVAVDKEATAEGIVVYLVVPAGNYADGITVKVIDVNGHYMEKSTADARNLEKGKIYAMPAFEFAPTGTEFNVDITTASELVAFAKEWNKADEGEYAQVSEEKPLVVNLLNDIEFTEDDITDWPTINNFSQKFNGNGFTISNFQGSKPVFAHATGTIQNVSLSGNMEVTVVMGDSHENIGTLFGYVNGGCRILNCHSSVDLSVTASYSSGSKALRVGGLAGFIGEVDALIDGCSYSGDLVLKADLITGGNQFYGGITAAVNAASVIRNSVMEGTLTMNGTDLADGKYATVGGVTGYTLNAVEGCSMAEGAAVNIAGNVSDLKVGGIVGITANEAAALTDCTNNGDVSVNYAANATSATTYVGGILGWNSDKACTLTTLTNNGNVTFTSDAFTSTDFAMGGVVGNAGAGLALASGTSLTNNGNVTWNSSNGYSTANTLNIAGVAGKTSVSLSGLNNAGIVKFAENAEAAGVSVESFLCLAGCVGSVSVADLTISGCSNSGEVNFDVTGYPRMYNKISVGGVLAYSAKDMKVKVSDCSHSGIVQGGLNETANDGSTTIYSTGWKYFGGIVGYLRSGSISKGTTTGRVANMDYNIDTKANDGPCCGGIVGRAGYSTNDAVSISECSVISYDEANDYVTARRGRLGGIAGYVISGTISDCTSSSPVKGQGFYYGGIAGQVADKGVITGCSSTSHIESGQLKFAGGIAGSMSGTSPKIIDCQYSGNMESTKEDAKFGGIVGNVASGASDTAEIKDCKFKGTYNNTSFELENIIGNGSITEANKTGNSLME